MLCLLSLLALAPVEVYGELAVTLSARASDQGRLLVASWMEGTPPLIQLASGNSSKPEVLIY